MSTKPFRLLRAMQIRRALTFAKRLTGLTPEQRMRLGKAQKTLPEAFGGR